MLALLLMGCGQFILGVEATSWDSVVTDSLEGAQVVDAREAEAWDAGHVPGSAQVHWTELTGFDDDELWDVRPPEELAALLGERGVREDEPVVIVGGGVPGWGDDGNLYWTLRYLGHTDVRVYNGGFAGWLAAGGEPSTDADQPAAGTFVVEVDGEVYATTDEVEEWEGVILDVRSEEEWLEGHVPGALHMEWDSVFVDDAALLPQDEIRGLLEEHGITEEVPVVTYCAAGIRAGHTFMVLDALGQARAANYVGSWARWTSEDGEVALP